MVCAAMVAQADVSVDDQLDFRWNNDLDGYSVRARSGEALEGVLEIPEKHFGHFVVEIPDDAFNPQGSYNSQHPNTTGITKVVLPEHLLKIGNFAFHNLTNLTEVDMSLCIDAEDFGGKSIFKDCSRLTTVKLPDNTVNTKLKRIAPGMFCGTPLTTITLPYSVSEIGYGAFKDCHSLETIYQYYQPANASPARNHLWVNVIEHHAFDCSTNNGTNQLEDIGIHYRNNGYDDYIRHPNLVIQNDAFRGNKNLKSIAIDNPGVVVGDYAFDGTAITSFPNRQLNVGYRAFPTSLKFNDPLYEAGNSNYANSYVSGTKHDKYSHVYNNAIQYLYNTRTYNFKQWNGEQLASNVPVLDIPDVNSDLAPQCKRLGYVVDGANTTADNLAVEPLTSMIDGYALRGSNYKTLTLNTDNELKYIESGAFGNMKNLRELTLPSSVKRFGAGSYSAHVLYWGEAIDLDYGGYGVGSSGWGIAHDTPVMAYLDMSTVDKSAFASWWEEDEFSVGASLFNGTDTYRSNSGWYWQNCFDGMYEPTLVFLPTNTEDKWKNEDFEVYGRNFIFTNAGETPYCHLYETYDYDVTYKALPWNYDGSDYSEFYLGRRSYYAIPHAFKAETAKYNRNFKKGLMYTVCIPFAVDAGKYGTFYEPSRYDGSTLYVKPIRGETTQPRTPYVFVPNDDYTVLEANNVMVSAIPDGSVESKVATGTASYVEDEVVFSEDGEVMAKLCGGYETRNVGNSNGGNSSNYGQLLTNGTIDYRGNQVGLSRYPYHALIWAKNRKFTKIVPEGDGRPEITGVYRSTFDVENVENDYRNSVRLVNPETQPMLADQFSTGTTMRINRVDHKGDSHVIANIAITGKDETTLNYRLTMTNSSNEQTGTFSIDAGNVVNFNDLTVEDVFSASTATNEHIGGYDYQLTMIDAKGNDIKTNVVEVPVYKTRYLATGAGFTSSQISADTDHSMSLRHTIPAEMRMYSDAAITGYELLRNKQTVGSSAEKADGSSTYVVGGYGLNNGEIEWMDNLNKMEVTDDDGWLMVDMQDAIDPEEEESTTVNYLPRISAKTTDFDGTTVINNTYGGVENNIVACDVQIEVSNPEKTTERSDDNDTWGFEGQYQGYAATVKLKAVLPNDDYQVYLYRLWRVLPDGTETLLNNYSSTSANRNYAGYKWGSDYTALQKRDLEIEIRDVFVYKTITQLGGSCPTKYIARLYARTPKPAAQAPRGNRISSTGYDAAEKVGGVDFSSTEIPTAIGVVKSDSGVQKVTYYNTAGVSSSTPFDGLNVVVTVKADGTRQVTKMVK